MESALKDLLTPILDTYPVVGVVGAVGWFFRGLLLAYIANQKQIIEWQQTMLERCFDDDET